MRILFLVWIPQIVLLCRRLTIFIKPTVLKRLVLFGVPPQILNQNQPQNRHRLFSYATLPPAEENWPKDLQKAFQHLERILLKYQASAWRDVKLKSVLLKLNQLKADIKQRGKIDVQWP